MDIGATEKQIRRNFSFLFEAEKLLGYSLSFQQIRIQKVEFLIYQITLSYHFTKQEQEKASDSTFKNICRLLWANSCVFDITYIHWSFKKYLTVHARLNHTICIYPSTIMWVHPPNNEYKQRDELLLLDFSSQFWSKIITSLSV